MWNSVNGRFTATAGGARNAAIGYASSVGGGQWNTVRAVTVLAAVVVGTIEAATPVASIMNSFRLDDPAATACALTCCSLHSSEQQPTSRGHGDQHQRRKGTTLVCAAVGVLVVLLLARVWGVIRCHGCCRCRHPHAPHTHAFCPSPLPVPRPICLGPTLWPASCCGGPHVRCRLSSLLLPSSCPSRACGVDNPHETPFTVITGGASNVASGYNSAVLGGSSNAASGSSATVVGGNYNNAGGHYTAVAGGARVAGLKTDWVLPLSTADGAIAYVVADILCCRFGRWSFFSVRAPVPTHERRV
jgi:hypothetical protein